MVGRFFETNDKICIIFDNEQYDRLREIPEFSKRRPDIPEERSLRNLIEYCDMPRAREWANEFEEGIKDYGFSPQQI